MLPPLVSTSLVNVVVLVGEHAAVAYAVAPDVLAAMDTFDGWYWSDSWPYCGQLQLHVFTWRLALLTDTSPEFWQAYQAVKVLTENGLPGHFAPVYSES